jgi:hypothetical protein
MLDNSLFTKLKLISKTYIDNVAQAVDDLCNAVENMFVSTYYEHLFFKRSFTWTKPIAFLQERGLRLDRVFECEVQAPVNKTLTIACRY